MAQEIKINVIVKDFETDLPIDEVTVTSLKTRQGFLTNAEGEVTIQIPRHSVLEFHHSSYNDFSIKSDKLTKEKNVVYLDSKTQLLEEVILTKDHPQDILKKIVETSRKKITIPANLKVYLREFFKKNDKYLFYNDGLMNFQIYGEQKKIKTDILLEQNRSIGLWEDKFDDDILGYNLNNIIENYYKFKYLDEILAKKDRKDYDFQVKTFPTNEDYLVITATPLDQAKGMLSDFYVVYHAKKKLIIEVSALLSRQRVQLLEEQDNTKFHKLEFKNVFHLDGNFYHLSNSKEVVAFYRKVKGEKQKIEVKNNMVITEFNKRIFGYEPHNVFKDKSLINKKSTVFTNFWENKSGLKPTQDEEKILESLAITSDSIDVN